MSDTINNKIPFVPENTIDPAAALNLSLNTVDALLQVLVQSVGLNTPPTGVAGQRFIVGTSPTGAWSSQANKLARFIDGAWQFFDARYALSAADGVWYVRPLSAWVPLSADSEFENPMTAVGDLIVGGAGGAPSRLPIGSEGQVPVVRDGLLTYEAQAGGAVPYAPVIVDASTTRVLSLSDAGNYFRFISTLSVSCTVPAQSSVTWAAYTEIHIRRAGVGILTITGAPGVTVNPPGGGTLTLTAGMSITLKRVASDEWDLIGQTVSA